MKRESGILLPIYSLPSVYGCGSLGKEAYNFIDFLKAAGQSVWQVLPIGPVNDSHSPYQSISSFAGNPYYIDIDLLVSSGLLTEDEAEKEALLFKKDGECDEYSSASYDILKKSRYKLLEKAWERGKKLDAFLKYRKEKSDWLFDYALYASAREYFGCGWTKWPDEGLKRHEASSVSLWNEKLSDRTGFYCFMQYLFSSQWDSLKKYAKEKGITIIGDIPVYVPADSADIWAERQFFLLDEDDKPKAVAGVPPDYFNEEGQLWGNPLYDWESLKKDGYGFWIRRIGRTLEYFDVIRIDHFRGFDSYWAVPPCAESSKAGRWEKGPGFDFVNVISSWFGKEHFIAEDLGDLSESVRRLLNASGFPGMTVLEFAFDSPENAYLPHNHKKNTVCYIGTHDNNTLLGWINSGKESEKALSFAAEYLGTDIPKLPENKEAFAKALIRAGMSSVSDLFIMQMQDWLFLDERARTNTPGTAAGNWKWMLRKEFLTDKLSERINKITRTYSR